VRLEHERQQWLRNAIEAESHLELRPGVSESGVRRTPFGPDPEDFWRGAVLALVTGFAAR
jgi:hypothetical protein